MVNNKQIDLFKTTYDVSDIFNSLSKIRIGVIYEEFTLQNMISKLLEQEGIQYYKEYKLAPKNRIDFLIPGGIGIEIKKGKPNQTQVLKQISRYTSFDEINTLILVVERNVDIPNEVNGKKCYSFGLNKLWGVAL